MNIAVQTHAELRQPGLGSEWLGMERYIIRGGAVVVIPLAAGDHVELVDPEGLQCAHVLAFNSSGAGCTESLGLTSKIRGDSVAALLQNNSFGSLQIRHKLRAFDVELKDIATAELLTGETIPGSSVSFVCESDCIAMIAAPGENMQVDKQNPTTDLIAWVQRNQISKNIESALPEPLAEPVQDFAIKAATAQSYEVKAGQYIQTIDVDGRQCSDFQCFDLHKLGQGVERCLDATVTRTLMGSAYPAPGLHAKFYDVDLAPLVEVVQDTCGRHDSFGLACTSKFYDDMGYPGHVNCSDNFNDALERYSIAPRKGWMAINLFFNTFFDDDYQLYSDEPWSRPGDFVLMQALRDMICISSACPDDIDPANGWNPTDIQHRDR